MPGTAKQADYIRRNSRGLALLSSLPLQRPATPPPSPPRNKKQKVVVDVLSDVTGSEEEDADVEERFFDPSDEFETVKMVRLLPSIPGGKILQPHQKQAFRFLQDRLFTNQSGAILAHSMGMGKTLTVITLLRSVFLSPSGLGFRAVVVVPITVMTTWQQEFAKFAPEMVVLFINSSSSFSACARQFGKKGGVIVMSDYVFRKYASPLSGVIDLLVIDEAHRWKNPNGLSHSCVMGISTRRRLLLTGTPLQNSLQEYYNMLTLISDKVGDDALFKQHFEQPIIRGMFADSSSSVQSVGRVRSEVFRRIVEPYVHRAKISNQYSVTTYKIAYTPSEEIDSSTGIFRQRCDTLDKTVCDKVKIASTLFAAILKHFPNEDVICFSQNLKVLGELHKSHASRSYLMIGEVSHSSRESIVTSFQASTGGSILFSSLMVGCVGLNFPNASRVVLLDLHWNPQNDEQAIHRVLRPGQVRSVLVYKLVASGLEEHIYRLHLHKKELASLVMDDKDSERLFSESSLRSLDPDPSPRLSEDKVKDSALRSVLRRCDVSVSLVDPKEEETSVELSDDEKVSVDFEYAWLSKLLINRRISGFKDGSSQIIGANALYCDPPFQSLLAPPHPPVVLTARSDQRFLSMAVMPEAKRYRVRIFLKGKIVYDLHVCGVLYKDKLSNIVIVDKRCFEKKLEYTAAVCVVTGNGEESPFSKMSAVFSV